METKRKEQYRHKVLKEKVAQDLQMEVVSEKHQLLTLMVSFEVFWTLKEGSWQEALKDELVVGDGSHH